MKTRVGNRASPADCANILTPSEEVTVFSLSLATELADIVVEVVMEAVDVYDPLINTSFMPSSNESGHVKIVEPALTTHQCQANTMPGS